DQAARLPDQALADAGARASARPGAGRAHRRGAGRGRLLRRAGRGDGGGGSGQGARRGAGAGAVPRMSAAKAPSEEMLRMGELARASGVSAATIKHYLREGLLPEPVKTSRNMAYYPAEFVDRIRLIKQLQEERYMP